MKRWIVLTILMIFGASLPGSVLADTLTLTSPQLPPGGQMAMAQVFKGFGCTGENISPQLNWKGAPAQTKSFAVTAYDPDAPTGSGWWHWVVFNIPPTVHELKKGAGDPKAGLAPAGIVQSRTDYGLPGYGGACPPPGDKPHRYIFTVYALDIAHIDLDANAPAAMVGFYLHQHTLAKATLTVHYGRK